MASWMESIRIGEKTVKNRIVMPPMVMFGLNDGQDCLTDIHTNHYAARAAAGVGLIVVEAVSVLPTGRFPGQRGLDRDENIASFARCAEACHKHGAVVLTQIHHIGYNTGQNPMGPSNLTEGRYKGRGMSLDEIYRMRDAFIATGVRAWKAGMDGVELHGCHEYLLNAFANPEINLREDAYGGDVTGRIRLASEIIAGIRAECGPGFLITVRMGCNDPDIPTGLEIADAYVAAGAQALSVSAGMGNPQNLRKPADYPFSVITYLGTAVKEHLQGKVPVMGVFGIRTGAQAAQLIREEYADMACVGKAMLADPDWLPHALADEQTTLCKSCRLCQWYECPERCPPLFARRKNDPNAAM